MGASGSAGGYRSTEPNEAGRGAGPPHAGSDAARPGATGYRCAERHRST
ncbi:hypothetical protein [Streptomyces hainanensis]|nr:hypothetical protein [Streptomyces hainanensis]